LRTSPVAPQRFELVSSAASCARWIRAAAGGATATVRVATPDSSGRLRVIVCEGPQNGSSRLRSSRRRTVFRTQRPVNVPIKGSIGLSLGIFPLTCDGDPLGVVEVLGETRTIELRMDVLLALVRHSAIVLSAPHEPSETEQGVARVNTILHLARGLLSARTAVEAVRLTVGHSHRQLGTPVAGLLPDRDGWGWFLADAKGLGLRKRSGLQAALREKPDEPRAPRVRLHSLGLRFREASGCREVVAVRSGAAVLLFGDVRPGHDDLIGGVSSLLAEVLPQLGLDGVRAAKDPSKEVGIAWTAHEMKGPLVGAQAALDRAVGIAAGSEGQELLRRTNEELAQLSDLIDPLLRWSSGADTLQRQRVDLVQVTREAVATSSFGLNADRVSIEAPGQLFVRADPRHLRSAIVNVVRNALIYSPGGSLVSVRVGADDGSARVVVRDRGPGISPEERETVFDPFSRGRVSGVDRPGSGLGLFIARRVLEAHGGSISLRPSKTGATFVLDLPVEAGWPLSAS
jgi:hypothetical protein